MFHLPDQVDAKQNFIHRDKKRVHTDFWIQNSRLILDLTYLKNFILEKSIKYED